MLVWGGHAQLANGIDVFIADGARYRPAMNAWFAIALSPLRWGRIGHAAVWTGTEMLIWGGLNPSQGFLGDGAAYNPATDAWRSISSLGAPSPRAWHASVWTGRELIVWGGIANSGGVVLHIDTGAAYNPTSDTWRPLASSGAPGARGLASAVWTGSPMLVWGGLGIAGDLNDGGRYDPATDAWLPMATPTTLSARHRHTAVWTGKAMLVWGGGNGTQVFADGGGYDPATNTWTALSLVGAPSPRLAHGGYWTQAFQKLVLQWRPEWGRSVPVNVLDELNTRGLDDWLDANRQVPPAAETSGDTGLAWEAVVARHLGRLDGYPELRAFYDAEPDALETFGLPLSVKDYGGFVAVRLQRATFQLWRDPNGPRVVVGNAGDLAKEVGLWPVAAVMPLTSPVPSPPAEPSD